MAEDNQEERVKRYLQWATILVLVAVAVTAIDLTIKQGILRAVKEASEANGKQTITASSSHDSSVNSGKPMDFPPRDKSNSTENADGRVSRTPPPTDSETDQSSSDVL